MDHPSEGAIYEFNGQHFTVIYYPPTKTFTVNGITGGTATSLAEIVKIIMDNSKKKPKEDMKDSLEQ